MKPKVALAALDANYRSARSLRGTILMADRFDQPDIMHEAVSDLVDVIEDTSDLLDTAGLSVNPSRLPPIPWTPDEMIDELRLAVAIDGIAIDLLLTDRPDFDLDDHRVLLASARKLIRTLGLRARATKRAIKDGWPELWTNDLEEEFQKILNIAV